mmetsp:Transcript_35628/g.70635  ORF Transcript_35628/g.70635 Transcript_35628/m.70635 type:complete len:280 (-) Transcript_35628:168-1007(-)
MADGIFISRHPPTCMPSSPLSMPRTTSRKPRRNVSGLRVDCFESNTLPSGRNPSYRILTFLPKLGTGPLPNTVSLMVRPPPRCLVFGLSMGMPIPAQFIFSPVPFLPPSKPIAEFAPFTAANFAAAFRCRFVNFRLTCSPSGDDESASSAVSSPFDEESSARSGSTTATAATLLSSFCAFFCLFLSSPPFCTSGATTGCAAAASAPFCSSFTNAAASASSASSPCGLTRFFFVLVACFVAAQTAPPDAMPALATGGVAATEPFGTGLEIPAKSTRWPVR